MSRTLCRLAVTAVSTAAVSLVALAPSPALAAGSFFFQKTSGRTASVTWLEVGALPAPILGNAHFGDLFVEDMGANQANVFGTIHDVECAPGATPYLPLPGHGGEPAPPGPCALVGERFIGGGDVRLVMDKKLTTATLTGTLSVFNHGDGAEAGNPPVSITWTGFGATTSRVESGRETTPEGTFSYRFRTTGREARIAKGGKIGPMVFDDEVGERSSSFIGTFSGAQRRRV